MHGCLLWQETVKIEDKALENYKNKILGQDFCKHKTSHVLFNTEIIFLKDN